MFAGTRLEDDLADLFWAFVDLFHREGQRVERELDGNGRRSESQLRTGRLRGQVDRARTADRQGLGLISGATPSSSAATTPPRPFRGRDRRARRPQVGSIINHRTLTSAMIDSRTSSPPQGRRADHRPRPPAHRLHRRRQLQRPRAASERPRQLHARHSDMVLVHGGSPRGSGASPPALADSRKVAQVAFKTDWTRDRQGRAVQAQRRILDALPIGVVAFPGSASPPTSPTRPRSAAFPCGGSARQPRRGAAALKRRSPLSSLRAPLRTPGRPRSPGVSAHDRAPAEWAEVRVAPR